MPKAAHLSQFETIGHRPALPFGKRVSVRRSAERRRGAGPVSITFPNDRLSGVVALGTALLTIFDVALYFVDRAAHWRLVSEDALVENLTFVFWLTAGLYVLATLHHRHMRFFFTALALGMIWVAGEEISWGQRLFAIATPAALAAINQQGELNLHNIIGIHQHIKALGLLLIMSYGLALPVLYRSSQMARHFVDTKRIPLFRPDAAAMIVLAVALMAIPRALGMDNDFDEIGEMVLGSAFFLFAFDRQALRV